MIPMTCPSCGRRGNVPPDRLNTRMHCKKCDAVFFMDRTGKIVLGDPDIVLKKKKDQAQKASPAKGGKPGSRKKKDEDITSFTQLILRLPTPVKVVAGLIALIGGLYIAGARLPRLTTPVPTTLEEVAAFVANAWVDEKPESLQKFVMPGNEEAAKSWYDEYRPRFIFKGPQDPKMGHTVEVVFNGLRDQEGGGKIVMVNFYATYTDADMPAELKHERDLNKEKKTNELRPAEEIGYKWNNAFTLPLVFSQDGEKWRLDVAKSIEASKPKEPEGKKKR